MGCVAQICNRFELQGSQSIEEYQILTLNYKKELYQPKKISKPENLISLTFAEDESLEELIQECDNLEKQHNSNKKTSILQIEINKQERLVLASTSSIPSSAFINLENFHNKSFKDELSHNTLSKDGTPISALSKKKDLSLSPGSRILNKQKKKVRFNKCYIRLIRVQNQDDNN